ncbi:hypothetical protein K493DRAFT_311834 [Basidiobolus meristosporus CBS 931.73]|uniref:C2H2-type domain-containing protein n=1 Tax=Basidiobolus meristosporus CBS 931.73 TaxID=1314790 RepID=A0A1Y1YYH5_9FUNG|nr:hypothetical protein K493DRAFT_311834 [Basidiobolus meristosporus CBS 931.73]|eukprot:ORY03090.1 hypothetical protein K493DRAFT_311834 [Basidiobolus meristosporus CBS 931.73]
MSSEEWTEVTSKNVNRNNEALAAHVSPRRNPKKKSTKPRPKISADKGDAAKGKTQAKGQALKEGKKAKANKQSNAGAKSRKDSTTNEVSAEPKTRQRSNSEASISSVKSDSSVEEEAPAIQPHILILCPFNDCSSETKPFTDPVSLKSHLKEQHNVVFRHLTHMYIALEKYLSFWAKKVEEGELDTYAKKETTEDGEFYIIDPAQCPIDKEKRDELQREKLNEILRIQDKERHEDCLKSRKCLFCKNVCDNRPILFKHMFGEHNFNIGLPDNLVDVDEFLDILEGKLNNLQCLYCEKIFTSPAVLRKHMRKKKHFKISARNRMYDRFYVINYLEPGKNWETFENEKYDSEEDRRDDSWADWDEEEPEQTMCLFDDYVAPSPKDACEHMVEAHGFDLKGIQEQNHLDFYKTITLINYIRHKTANNTCMGCGASFETLKEMTEHMEQNNCFQKVPAADSEIWKDPQYLFPTYENDPLLTGIDDSDEFDESDEVQNSLSEMQLAKEAVATQE